MPADCKQANQPREQSLKTTREEEEHAPGTVEGSDIVAESTHRRDGRSPETVSDLSRGQLA